MLFVCEDGERELSLHGADQQLTWHARASPEQQNNVGRQQMLFAIDADAHGGRLEARRLPPLRRAASSARRGYHEIAREIIAGAGEIDAAEDERYGDPRSDALAERLTSRDGTRASLRETKERPERERGSPEAGPAGSPQASRGPSTR